MPPPPGGEGRARRRDLPAAAGLLLAIGVSVHAAPARASCCVLEDPLVAVNDAAARGRDLRLALDAEVLSSEQGMDGMPGLEQVRQRTFRATVVYSPLDGVNAVVSIPLTWREWSGQGELSRATGIADVDVGVRLAAWTSVAYVPDPTVWAIVRAQALAVSAGTSLPTGSHEVELGGVRADEHAQLGTGAWGPYAGALYRLQQDPWELVASVTGRVRTTNAHGYRYARGLLSGAELQRRVLDGLALGAGADIRWASADLEGGVPVANTGGVLVSALASASVRLRDALAFRVRVQVPAAARLAGEQRPGVTAAAGVQLDLR